MYEHHRMACGQVAFDFQHPVEFSGLAAEGEGQVNYQRVLPGFSHFQHRLSLGESDRELPSRE